MQKLLILAAFFCMIGCSVKRAVPRNENGIYKITVGETELEINPETGGKIASLKVDGKNFLTGREVHPKYWGSSLWPSPQKEWGGSLPPELDDGPYSVRVENDVIKMISGKDSRFGYVFSKEISGDRKKNSFNIKYTITNRSSEVRHVSPWEVTRVHTNGFAFYPKGPGERRGNLAGFAEDKDGITWFVYDEVKIPATHNKFFADGSEGWIAQVNGDVIFIKKFIDVPGDKAAPGESEIEVYADPKKSYVEIEQQGAYEKLNPGDSLVWEVKWFLRKIPSTVNRDAGSKELVAYVREIVGA
jgi:hypothetical protein